MVLSEARGLRLFSVVQGGIGLHRRLGAEGKNEASQCYWILSLEPERLKEPDSLAIRNDLRDGTDSSAKDAQAACCFKWLASKRTSFFQTINVIAAIFRAKVRRAMVGFLPLTSKAS